MITNERSTELLVSNQVLIRELRTSDTIIRNEITTTATPKSAGMRLFIALTSWKEKMSLSKVVAGSTMF